MARTMALWAGPRNGSTALMYSFAQRSDTRVLDEPLFGHFLSYTGVSRPSRQDVLQSMPLTRSEALQSIQPEASDQILFLKHMANHLEGLSWKDVHGEGHKHIILTRHPDGVLPSYRAQIDEPTMLDLGYEYQKRILTWAQPNVIVVTAETLFEQPEKTLKLLCKAIELDWDEHMLAWKPGGRPEDGVWAKHWYHGVHRSSGWEARSLRHGETPPHLEALRNQCLEHYLELESHSLKP